MLAAWVSSGAGWIMRTELLEEFIVWADDKTIESAARKCNISQSTLSKHLASLEAEMGVSLVDRSDKSRLTPAGVHFYNSAVDIVDRLHRAVNECRSIDVRKEHRITVWDPFVFSGAMNELERLMRLFNQRYQEPFRFVLWNEECKTPGQAFREGAVDVSLRYDPVEDGENERKATSEDFTEYPLLEEPIVMWCSKAHPLARKETLLPSDLRGVPIMCSMELAHPLKACIETLCKKHGFRPRFYRFNPRSQAGFFFDLPSECVHLFTAALSRDERIRSRGDMTIVRFADPSFAVRASAIVRNDEGNEALVSFKAFLADECGKWEKAEAGASII